MNPLRWFLIPSLLGFALLACSQSTYPDRSNVIVDSVAVTSMLLWPSGLRYLAVGESVVVELHGLQRGYACSKVLESKLIPGTSHDTLTLRSLSKVEIPGNPTCAFEPSGLDTTFRFLPAVASTPFFLVLKTPSNKITDSARIVTATVHAESLSYVRDTTGRLVKGKFTYRDSTATYPRRSLFADSSSRCEILQGAVYIIASDTVKVRFHRLVLDSVKHASLPPCSGRHRDSLNVVSDRFLFPRL